MTFICDAISKLFKKSQPASTTFAMLGDSVVAYMASYQAGLTPPYNTALNLGVAGETTTAIKARVSQVPPNAQVVLLEGGANNYTNNIVASIVVDYQDIIKSLPNASIIILGMTQVDEAVLDPVLLKVYNNKIITAKNGEINVMAGSFKNCVVAKHAQGLSLNGLTVGGIHPTGAGYSALVTQLLLL